MSEIKPKKGIEIIEPSKHLFSEVILRVEEERQTIAVRRRFLAYTLVLLASLSGLIPLIRTFVQGLSSSGFTRFLSLLFTDSNVIIQHWQDFGYSLLESFPVMALVSVLGLAVVFLYALQVVTQEFKRTTRSFRPMGR